MNETIGWNHLSNSVGKEINTPKAIDNAHDALDRAYDLALTVQRLCGSFTGKDLNDSCSAKEDIPYGFLPLLSHKSNKARVEISKAVDAINELGELL